MLPHWTQNDLPVNNINIHYYRTGNGNKHPLVLPHGFSDNGLCWALIARDLEVEPSRRRMMGVDSRQVYNTVWHVVKRHV